MRGQAAIERTTFSADRRGQAAIEGTTFPARSLRGQAAIEYLMTYGWAILALVIIVSVLLFSGILSPNYLISEECNLGSNLPCEFAVFNKGDQTSIRMRIHNGFAYGIRINKVEGISRSGQEQTFSETPSQTPIKSGSELTITKELDAQIPTSSVARFFVNITYASCAPEVTPKGKDCSDSNHTIVGRITGRVIEE